jgi:hypothetical protein
MNYDRKIARFYEVAVDSFEKMQKQSTSRARHPMSMTIKNAQEWKCNFCQKVIGTMKLPGGQKGWAMAISKLKNFLFVHGPHCAPMREQFIDKSVYLLCLEATS